MKEIRDSLFLLSSKGLHKLAITSFLKLVNVSDPKPKIIVDISPNPVRQMLSVRFQEQVHGHVYIQDVNGRSLFDAPFTDVDRMDHDLSDYTPGVYFVVLNIVGHRICRKIVKL